MLVNKAVIINSIKMADAAVMEMFYNVPTMTSVTKNGCVAVYFTANNYIVVFFAQ